MSIRTVTPRQWGTLMLVTAAAGHATFATAQTADHSQHQMGQVMLAQATEGGEGGEGGESGAAATLSSDAAYLANLGFIEGHLRSGTTLYAQGEAEMAVTHMKHPKDEIYTALEPELEERGQPGFADALATLASGVEAGEPAAQADADFAALLDQIEAAKGTPAPRAQFDALTTIARTAAEEYAIGVKDGQIENLHEYQDAWGFLQTVRARAEALAGSDDATVATAAEGVLAAVAETDAAFDTLTPQGAVPGGADLLYGAAARIELAALSVK